MEIVGTLCDYRGLEISYKNFTLIVNLAGRFDGQAGLHSDGHQFHEKVATMDMLGCFNLPLAVRVN